MILQAAKDHSTLILHKQCSGQDLLTLPSSAPPYLAATLCPRGSCTSATGRATVRAVLAFLLPLLAMQLPSMLPRGYHTWENH